MPGSRFKIFGRFLVPALLVAGIATNFSSTSANGGDDEFDRPGNNVIADQFNNRVIRRQAHRRLHGYHSAF